MRALVIDDSDAMRAVLRNILEELHVEVVEACEGQDAMRKLETGGVFDVALIDRHMPVMDGLEWLRQVRASQFYPNMKVLMITSDNDIMKAVSSGVDKYISKPFRSDAIRTALVQLGLKIN